jgi:hypothetical protein
MGRLNELDKEEEDELMDLQCMELNNKIVVSTSTPVDYSNFNLEKDVYNTNNPSIVQSSSYYGEYSGKKMKDQISYFYQSNQNGSLTVERPNEDESASVISSRDYRMGGNDN